MDFFTASGTKIAHGYTRLVIGGRGEYIEFDPQHIDMTKLVVPDDQEYRLTPKYKDKVFYFEFRSDDPSNVMVYFQRRYVGYADYKPGLFYVSPNDLSWDGEVLRTQVI